MSVAWQTPLDSLMLVSITGLLLQVLLLFIRVDSYSELMVLLICSMLHLWCISVELHGDTLLNVAIPEHLSQEWLHHFQALWHHHTVFPCY